jgi:hypothetical protein
MVQQTSAMASLWIPIVATAGVFLFGALFAIIGNLIKVAIVNSLSEIKKEVELVKTQLSEIKIEMANDFVKKTDYEKNELSHEKIWKTMRKYGERVARVEMKLDINPDNSEED